MNLNQLFPHVFSGIAGIPLQYDYRWNAKLSCTLHKFSFIHFSYPVFISSVCILLCLGNCRQAVEPFLFLLMNQTKCSWLLQQVNTTLEPNNGTFVKNKHRNNKDVYACDSNIGPTLGSSRPRVFAIPRVAMAVATFMIFSFTLAVSLIMFIVSSSSVSFQSGAIISWASSLILEVWNVCSLFSDPNIRNIISILV